MRVGRTRESGHYRCGNHIRAHRCKGKIRPKFHAHVRSWLTEFPFSVALQTAILYFVAQFLGAFMGYGALKALVPASVIRAEGGIGLCVTMPDVSLQVWQAFGVEFIATATFIWFCCGVWDPRNAHLQDCVPLKFGLAVAGLAAVTVRHLNLSAKKIFTFNPNVFHTFRAHSLDAAWIRLDHSLPPFGMALCNINGFAISITSDHSSFA